MRLDKLLGSALLISAAVFSSGFARADDVEARVNGLLEQLTLAEKIQMLGGNGQFDSLGVPRLGIPGFKMTDGPTGISNAMLEVGPKATAYPAAIALASSWDPSILERTARAIADEAKSLGRNMLLGPCVNIARAPQGGRNFETYSEDPYLAARMAEAYVRGVQAQGVISTVKHFALNNQEEGRLFIDIRADEDTMRKLYFPAFQAAVRAGSWAVMSSYNRINGAFASESEFLLKRMLKEEWGFKGIVVSDWGATSKVTSASAGNAGLDIEMPWAFVFAADPMNEALSRGEITESVIDDKIRRQLRAMISMGILDAARSPSETPPADVPADLLEANRAVALEGARQGLVLLKNQGAALPWQIRAIRKLAVIGPGAVNTPIGGGGSAKVNAWRRTSLVDGLRELLPESAELLTDDGSDLKRAASVAKRADAVVLAVGWSSENEGEEHDRKSLKLPGDQARLAEAVLRANPRAAVVVNSGGMFVEERWVRMAPAILQSWYLGQEGGRAVAEALFGLLNPSGRLPISFARSENDLWTRGSYPYDPGSTDTATYREGIYVGYRHFRRAKLKPLFAFGHGLSYTRFVYENLEVKPARDGSLSVRFDLTNAGHREGQETPQLYAGALGELQAFQKVLLKAGERRRIEWKLPPETVALARGFDLKVGASSDDARLSAMIGAHLLQSR